jgi:hypothetical protein
VFVVLLAFQKPYVIANGLTSKLSLSFCLIKKKQKIKALEK